jgi:hypothetical protein
MDNTTYDLIVDTPEANTLVLSLVTGDQTVSTHTEVWQGHVDNILLTVVDNFLKGNRIDKSALSSVQLGRGIDNNSALCRILQSFAAAVSSANSPRTTPQSE